MSMMQLFAYILSDCNKIYYILSLILFVVALILIIIAMLPLLRNLFIGIFEFTSK